MPNNEDGSDEVSKVSRIGCEHGQANPMNTDRAHTLPKEKPNRSAGHLGFWRTGARIFEFYGIDDQVYRAPFVHPINDEGRKKGHWIGHWPLWPRILFDLVNTPGTEWVTETPRTACKPWYHTLKDSLEQTRPTTVRDVSDFESNYAARLLQAGSLEVLNPATWEGQHMNAVIMPRNIFERSLVSMLRGWLLYVDAHRRTYGSSIGDDRVLGDSWAQIGSGLRVLLNGERGRLDGGTLDRILGDTLQANDINPEEK